MQNTEFKHGKKKNHKRFTLKVRSISRPSLLGGSGTYSTLARRTQSAEDAVLDNQYEAGNLSAEYYLNSLQERLRRGYLTPLQQVALQKKMEDVQGAVTDAEVSRQYAAGEITTEQLLGYEKEKLERMSSPTSASYIKQQQKVQGLQDRAEKETRSKFRIAENLRISRLPEDTSENLWEKARLYQTLSEQARLDGDTSQADQLLTTANNYVNSAKKADVNDLITGARLSVSETPTAGRGVANAEGGAGILSQINGGDGVSGGTGLPSNGVGSSGGGTAQISTGFSGVQSSAVTNALESLDRQEKTYQRIVSQIEDKQLLIQRYKTAVDQATGDQKTTLTISLNNLLDDLEGLNSQLDNTTQNINDTVIRIREAQAKAALSTFKQEIRFNNNSFDQAETELEEAFRDGKISKTEYISKGYLLSQTKTEYLAQASEVFSQYGDDSSAESYVDKYSEMQQVTNSLGYVANNIDDYEPLAVEPGGKITNLFGKTLQPGQSALTNVRNLKDSGVFQRQYAAKEGKFYKVHFPSDITDANGDLLPAYVNEDLSKYNDTAYIYQTDAEGKIIGKDNPGSQIKFATINDIQRPFTSDLFNKMKDIGSITQDDSGSWIQTPTPKDPNLLIKTLAKAQGFLQEAFTGVKNIFSIEPTAQNQTPLPAQQTKSSIRLPQVVKEAEAAEPQTQKVGDIIDKVAEEMKPGDLEFNKVLHAIALAESGGDPKAVGDGGWSIGVFQNHMRDGRGVGYTKEELEDAEFNVRLSADELSKYYDQGIDRGLKGKDLVAYVSRTGQRPAPGNEYKAASKYGQFVSKAISGVQNLFAPRQAAAKPTDYTTEVLPDPRKTRNIELALGLKPGQYRTGLKQDQAAVDKGFRSDKQTQELLRSEGLKPSWEIQSIATQSAPIASSPAALRSQEPSFIQNVGQSVNNAAQQVRSTVSNAVQNISSALPKITLPKINIPSFSTPKPQAYSQPSILQRVSTAAKPVVQTISNAVKNIFGKIKSWF